MARRGYTQSKLSEETGISQPRISRMIFKNEASIPVSLLETIASALDIEPSAILRSAEKALRAEQAAELTRELPDADYYNALASRADYGLAANRGTELTDEDYYS